MRLTGGTSTSGARHPGRVVDDAWIVQHEHGPFRAREAPRGTAWPEGDASPEREFDHWTPLLGLPPHSALSSSAQLRTLRAEIGEEAWGRKEDELLRLANRRMGGGAAATATTYEDVRADGNSDGAWFVWKNAHGESQQ